MFTITTVCVLLQLQLQFKPLERQMCSVMVTICSWI